MEKIENDKIKVVIVDDELRAVNRIKILLSNFSEIDIIGQFIDPELGSKFIMENRPDVVFLDVEMPGKSGLEICQEIRSSFLHTKVIFITSYDHYAIDGIHNGVFDYLLKPVSISALKKSIERFKAKTQLNLNKREIEIIGLIADGMNSKEIGQKVNISHNTVDTYRRSILEKTGCKNAAALVKYAVKIDLI